MSRTVITTTYGCNPIGVLALLWMGMIAVGIVTYAMGLWR